MYGWQACYGIMGAAGVLVGLAATILIREPERGRYLDEKTKMKEAKKKEAKAA